MSLIKVATNGMFWTTCSTITRSVVSLLQVAILTRYLSKADFGLVAIANLFIGFSNLFLDLGLSTGIMHKQDTTPKQYSSLFWLNIFMGIIITVILSLISPLVAKIYSEPQLIIILPLLSSTILLSSLGSQHKIIQQKKLRFKLISIIEIISSFITIITAFYLAYNGYGIYSLVYSTIIHFIFSNIPFLILGLIKDKNISFHFNLKETYPYLKIGVFTMGNHILNYFTREMDIAIVSATLGKEVLGVYSLCKKLVLAVYNIINPIIIKVITPILAKIQNDRNKLLEVYYNLIESLGLINYPIYAIIAIFSAGILNVIYGEQYIEGHIVFSLLAIYYGLLTTGNPSGSLQTALGRTDRGFYWSICRVGINSIAIYIGSTISIECMLLLLILISFISTPISWRIVIYPLIGGRFWDFFSKTFKPLLATTFLGSLYYIVINQVISLFDMIVLVFIFIIIYMLLLFIFFKQTFLLNTVLRYFGAKLLLKEKQ